MKTLIAYASKYGTTEKCAKAIGEKLKGETYYVDLNRQKPPSLDYYDYILVGGSVYMGKLLKATKGFITKNEKKLMEKRMGIFISCGDGDKLDAYLNVILSENIRNHAEVIANIGYGYHLEKMNGIFRKIIIDFAKISESVEKINDNEIKRVADIINS